MCFKVNNMEYLTATSMLRVGGEWKKFIRRKPENELERGPFPSVHPSSILVDHRHDLSFSRVFRA